MKELLEAAREAARRAGAAILEIYAEDFEVRRKADASPVTLADEHAERLIVEVLEAAAPGIPVVAEELCDRHGTPESPAPRFWLVDPLDGTKEFIGRTGDFSVNIGLVEDGKPVLGVVHVPARGLAYWAAGPGTAMRAGSDGAAVAIAARAPPPDGLVVAHSRSHGDNEALDAYLADLPVADRLVAGSAYKFCLLAEGSADLYPRFGPTMEWDTAAGHAILAAAGGDVATLDGAPFRYGKPGCRNPGFIARGKTG